MLFEGSWHLLARDAASAGLLDRAMLDQTRGTGPPLIRPDRCSPVLTCGFFLFCWVSSWSESVITHPTAPRWGFAR